MLIIFNSKKHFQQLSCNYTQVYIETAKVVVSSPEQHQ